MGIKKVYIDLFAGCGGLSLGLYQAGWSGLFAVEKNSDAFSTLKHNLIEKKAHFDWPNWLPCKNHDINTLIREYENDLKLLRGKVDLVAGGPPCQGFSTAGKRIESDARNQLINSYIRFIRLVQPKIILFENVKGFTQEFKQNKVKGRVYSKYVKDALQRKGRGFDGYKVYGRLINFADYGIPQKRTRFILVGIRKDLAKQISPKLFFDELEQNKETVLISMGLSVNSNLEQAISDLLKSNGTIESPDSKGFRAGIYGIENSDLQNYLRKDNDNKIPDSHRFSNHRSKTIEKFKFILDSNEKNKTVDNATKKKLKIRKHTLIPLDSKTPSASLTTLPDDYLHYSEPRIFTVREYARIQTFKDWYEFKGKYTTGGKMRVSEVPRYSQIGNAIPPLFGLQVGASLKKLI